MTQASLNIKNNAKPFGPEIEDLRLRVRLINKILNYIYQENLSITDAANKFFCSEMVISNLIHKKIWLFNNTFLLKIIHAAGLNHVL